MNDLALWKHYLVDMPRYALLNRHRMPDRIALEQEPFLKAGAAYLRHQLGSRFTSVSDDEIAQRASLVRLWRESDTYGAIGLGSPTHPRHVRMEGQEHLENLRGTARPIFMLTGHVGSFYFGFQSLAACGFNVFPVARSVDQSSATPKPTQHYLRHNYRLSERLLNRGHYLYTDYEGRFDRKIVAASKEAASVIPNLLDMPTTLYGGKRAEVSFLGGPCLMPVNFIQWAGKRKGVFLTYWTGYDSDYSGTAKPRRYVKIEPVIASGEPEAILQEYARRLESHVCESPWNWMALPIAGQYRG